MLIGGNPLAFFSVFFFPESRDLSTAEFMGEEDTHTKYGNAEPFSAVSLSRHISRQPSSPFCY